MSIKTLFILSLVILSLFSIPVFAQEEAGITPDSPYLYTLDRGLERARLLFTFTNRGKVEYLLDKADERAEEIGESLEINSRSFANTKREEILTEVEERAEKLDDSDLAEFDKMDVLLRLQKHRAVLERVLAKVPEQARSGIERALENADRLQIKVNETIDAKNTGGFRMDIQEGLEEANKRQNVVVRSY